MGPQFVEVASRHLYPVVCLRGFVISNPTDGDWKLYPQADVLRIVSCMLHAVCLACTS